MAEIKGPLPLSEEDIKYYLEHEGELYDFLEDRNPIPEAVKTSTPSGDYDAVTTPQK